MKSVRDRDYVCIEYPAVVENIDKALKTLGGEENISKTFQDPGKRLPLRWRPDEFYCKPAYADRGETTNLLIKVQKWRRKKKGRDSPGVQGDNQTSSEDVKYHTDVLGRVSTTYRFQSQADVQFLPMQKTEDGSYRSLIPDLMITKPIPASDVLQKEDVPMFLPPQFFSRLDQPTDYYYSQRQKPYPEIHAEIEKKDIIGVARKRRVTYTINATYHDPIPMKPMAGIEKTEAIIKKLGLTNLLEKVTEMFNSDRPIWSKSAIAHHLYEMPQAHRGLKHVLPLVAYYTSTGPWRSLWVRLGYDPKKDFNARHLQMVDFRVRQGIYVKNPNLAYKRSSMNYKLLTSVSKVKPQASTIHVLDTGRDDMRLAFQNDNVCKIRRGIIPPYHQMFYQTCDIEVKDVQDLLRNNVNNECTERDGWFKEGTIDEVRDLLSDCVSATFREMEEKNLQAGGKDDSMEASSAQLEEEDFINDSQDLEGIGEYEKEDEEDMEKDPNEIESELMDVLEHGTQINTGR